jgi:hypothetical protein
MDIKSSFLILLLIVGCNSITEPIEQNCDCSIDVYSNLPKQNEIYELTFNDSYVQTFTQLYVETECGLHTKVSWDTNYQYRFKHTKIYTSSHKQKTPRMWGLML